MPRLRSSYPLRPRDNFMPSSPTSRITIRPHVRRLVRRACSEAIDMDARSSKTIATECTDDLQVELLHVLLSFSPSCRPGTRSC